MKDIKQYCILIIFFLICGLPASTSAVSCKELNTPEKIKSFMKESHQSNPLLRKNVSLGLILDVCEGKVCRSKSKRAAQKETLRIQKLGTSGEYLRRKDPMHHVVLSSVVDEALSAQVAGLFPTRAAAVFLQTGALFSPEQILIRRILPLLQETRRT